MSVPFSVDIEAGFVSESEQGIQGVTSAPSHTKETPHHVLPVQGPLVGDAFEKNRDLYSTQSGERRTDEILEGWKRSAESILLFSGLFSATVSLFVIESYKRVSSDAVDQAADLFDKVSHLAGIPAGISPKPTLPSSLDAASLEPSSSAVCAITLWLLSLSLNIACVLWILWQQWRQQSTDSDSSTQGSEPHARVRAGRSSRVGPVAMGHMMKVIWVLSRASALLFLVGLAKFIPPIDTAVPWFPLGYLSLLALLYAVRVLLVVACQVFSD